MKIVNWKRKKRGKGANVVESERENERQ